DKVARPRPALHTICREPDQIELAVPVEVGAPQRVVELAHPEGDGAKSRPEGAIAVPKEEIYCVSDGRQVQLAVVIEVDWGHAPGEATQKAVWKVPLPCPRPTAT